MAKKRTRSETFTHMSNLIGCSREMLPSELPTLRDVLRHGLLLREQSNNDKRNYPSSTLAKDLYEKVLEKWQRANSSFESPVVNSKVTIVKRIEENWEKARNISLGRGKLAVKESFVGKLDKLFDILNCKCDILDCSDAGCLGICPKKVHIKCNCPREQKIPVGELEYIKGQRLKEGSIGSHQIGQPDYPENTRQVKKQKRLEEKNKRLSEHRNKEKEPDTVPSDQLHFTDDENEQIADESSDDDAVAGPSNADQEKFQTKKYNTLDIPCVATQSLRYGVGLRATAAIATAAYVDAGLVSHENDELVIDHSKVKRAQERVMKSLDKEFDEQCKKGEIECIFFDGRIDLTKVMTTVNGRQFPSQLKEEHYSICSEPGGRYLHHFTPNKSKPNQKPAEAIADAILEFLMKKGIDKTLMAIGGDSTNVNTGKEGGVMHWIEVKLNRKLVWLVCCLHTNELPLRHLIQKLDGKTLSNNKWSGHIGKLLDSVTDMDINYKFTKLPFETPDIQLTDEILKDLSTDQAYGYRISQAIRTGDLPTDLALLEIGPVSHSRWLTTANRLCRMWVSEHGLKGKDLINLRYIVEFIVGVYYPCWFAIKVKHSWVEGPRHVLLQLQLLQKQNKVVVDAVLPTIKRSAWFAHSEMILQSLLCSEDREERGAAIQKILDVRSKYGNGAMGNAAVRKRETPEVNQNATTLLELIDWQDTHEPLLTCHMSASQIELFHKKSMSVPDWPCHGQSIERCVKQVTEAASKVFTQEKRNGYIRVQEAGRAIMKKNESKKDLVTLCIDN